MIRASRPLRFIVIVVGGWIAMRVVVLWPESDPAAAPRETAVTKRPKALAVARAGPFPVEPARDASHRPLMLPVRPEPVEGRPQLSNRRPPFDKLRANGFDPAIETPARADPPRHTESPPLVASVAPSKSVASHRPSSRWGGSGWLIARGGGGAAVPFAPQLGGSQAGARVTYALGEARRVAIAARVSTALAMRQSEAAIGLDWRPTRHPIHLFAEQRIAIANARGGPTIGVIAGLPPTRLAAGFALEGYGQAGVIARRGGEGFVDAAVRAMGPVASVGNARVELGAGLWGGAQRGAARLDIGPAAGVILPTPRPLRIALEWRQRIAGAARPGAGVALSLGADF